MEKINFENLPSTNTPINANNLNTLQNNVENSFKNEYSESQTDTYSCDYLNPKILWTNPNPTSEMVQDTIITLNSTDYDVLEFFYDETTTNDRNRSIRCLKGKSTRLDYSASHGSTVTDYYQRVIQYVSNTSYKANSGTNQKAGETTADTDNTQCIPLYIIGYKIGLFN